MLLSPAAEPFLEQMAQRARLETSKHFGNTVYKSQGPPCGSISAPACRHLRCRLHRFDCGSRRSESGFPPCRCHETLHLLGHKRVWPYRFDAQERALMGGMRGVAFSALLGLSDFRKDALASALHVYYLQRKYPHAEMSLSCPRLRPIINNDQINPLDVHETTYRGNRSGQAASPPLRYLDTFSQDCLWMYTKSSSVKSSAPTAFFFPL